MTQPLRVCVRQPFAFGFRSAALCLLEALPASVAMWIDHEHWLLGSLLIGVTIGVSWADGHYGWSEKR